MCCRDRGSAYVKAPLVRYTVEFVWPNSPDRFRPAVVNVAEHVARRSVGALHRMRFRTRVTCKFVTADADELFLGTCMPAEWDPWGHVTEGDPGRFEKWIPGWALGRDPLEREKPDEPVPVGP